MSLLFGASACGFGNLADESGATARTETAAKSASAESVISNYTAENETPLLNVQGKYFLNNHKPDSEGYENSLTVTQNGGKIRVTFEGTFFFMASGAETFHDTIAEGSLQLNGNTARGKLIEEGSGNSCSIELNFSAEHVNLKSSNCDLRVTPDGVYKKNTGDAMPENTPEENGSDEPFIRYDQNGTPNSIVNLMEREGERTGCEKEIWSFNGKVLSVESPDERVYEFTLVSSDRKRKKISFVIGKNDDLDPEDVRSIIKIGNNLEVTYINCGNAPIATPTAIYKQ